MKTIEFTTSNINEIVSVLKSGGVIVYATETAYALGCDATNQQAAEKIFRIKGRNQTKPLPIIVATPAMARQIVLFSRQAKKIAEKYWPGPLTLVLPRRPDSPYIIWTAENPLSWPTIALRVSSNSTARKLSQKLGKPIISTSANPSGQPPAYSIDNLQQLITKYTDIIDLVIDAGQLPKRPPSTIVKIVGSKFEIRRQGDIKVNLDELNQP